MPRSPLRNPLPPLDIAALERLALRYVERFATTRGKLADYLRRKVRERGWEGPPADPVALAERMAGLGYVDDRAWAEARAAVLARRGMGARRAAEALMAARVTEPDRTAAIDTGEGAAAAAAIAFARRKRIGPWAKVPADPALRQKQVAALIRAGHTPALARRLAAAEDESELADLFDVMAHCEDGLSC
jgi:regulatory protein